MSFQHPNLLRLFLGVLSLAAFSQFTIAQKNVVSGVVTDTLEKKKLQYAAAALIDLKDTTLYKSVRTDEKGVFAFSEIPPGKYTLLISYPRMADYLRDIEVKDTSKLKLGEFPMTLEAVLLQEVIVRSSVAPIRMKGDTLEYTADSFKVKEGANVEALLKRLPGVIVEKNGRIIAQGQEVKKVLVDGDEFFADDPKLAAKYLAAGAVDKVQVYDGKSANAVFTGIDDGERTKTINLKLKADKRNGHFGKLAAGSDGKENYNTEAMGAIFRNDMKVSVFGLASHTDKEGLGYNELSKYVAKDYERIDDGTGTIYYTSNSDYENEDYYGNGIPSVLSGGAHFSNKWKQKREKLFTNYRIKRITAAGWENGNNYTVMPDGTSFYNTSASEEDSYNFSQKASGTYTMPLDSMNTTLQFSVNGNLGENTSNSESRSDSRNEKSILVNNSTSKNGQSRKGGNFEANVTLRHKFIKEGRSLVLSLQQQYTGNNTDDLNYSYNNYFDATTGAPLNTVLLDQLQRTHNTMQSLGAKGSYIDKISDQWNYALEYGFKSVNVDNVFGTFNKKDAAYQARVDSLSIDYNFLATTHITGATISWHKSKLSFTLGSNFFLTGFRQTNRDVKQTSKRSFVNFAPRVVATIRLKDNRSISVNYSGSTQQPGVNQLQPLRRSSNPLYVTIGNPDLKPEFRNNITLNYNNYNWKKGRNMYAYGNVSFTNNDVTSESFTDANGRTVSRFVNINGNYNYYGSGNYSWEYKKLHLKPGIQASVNGNTSYNIINQVKARNSNTSFGVGPGLSYSLPDKFDLSYKGNVNYGIGTTSLNNTVNRTFSHDHEIATTAYLPWKMELATDCNFSFQPKNKSFNSAINIVMWNASLQKKLFKGDKGEVKFSVSDLLNKRTGYSRYVYGNNTSESNRLVLKRYFLLTFTWNFASML
jgi:outer membrane receptor protein involved in Fe transport